MMRLLLAVLMIGGWALPACAEDAPPPSYNASAGVRYVDLDTKGSRGQVQEYDGKLYNYAHGDISVGNQGDYGLFDFMVKDIGSGEENGTLNLDYKDSFKASVKWDTLHHRQNYRRSGLLINGVWTANPNILNYTAADQNFVVRRSDLDFNVGLFNPENSAQWLTGEYWMVKKEGRMPAGYASYKVSPAVVNNTKEDFTVGLGSNLRSAGALSLDLFGSHFRDDAEVLAAVNGTAASTLIVKPQYGQAQMNGGEAKFRYDVSKKLAVTGAFTGRQRENMSTMYKANSAVGALNAAYMASNKLSLTARLYTRYLENDENLGYQSPLLPTQNPSTDTHLMDQLKLRGELSANYRPWQRLRLKAGYKLEANHRRDSPTQRYSAPRCYADGTCYSELMNDVARDDVRHTFTVGATGELPYGIEADADYRKLEANYPAFTDQNNKEDDVNGTLTVPLPRDAQLLLIAGYLYGKNDWSKLSQNTEHRNTYRAALDWAATKIVSFGADASWEKIKYATEGWFGSGSGPATVPYTGWHERLTNDQENKTAGGHVRVICPKGFVVMGNGSYTWSQMHVPLHFVNTPNNYTIEDYIPSDVQIARGGVTLEYTLPRYSMLTASAGYRIDDWVDKTDPMNSGRASIAQVGLKAKF